MTLSTRIAFLETLSCRDWPRWGSWIWIWLHSTKTNVLVNGLPGTKIKCRREMRQWDPFLCYSLSLLQMIWTIWWWDVGTRASLRGSEWEVVWILLLTFNTLMIPYLRFVTISLKVILFKFEMWSDLLINFYKSALILLLEKDATTYLVALILNCLV